MEAISIGQRFERLTVLGRKLNNGRTAWECVCDCGKSVFADGHSLRVGRVKSCGCYSRDIAKKAGERTRTHGLTRTPEHTAWASMKQRCMCGTSKDFPRYGGAGIKVCSRWSNSFQAFLDDMGKKPSPKHSLDRIDPFGDYEPINCRWAPPEIQNRNKRSQPRVSIGKESLSLGEWCLRFGIRRRTVDDRIARGWPIDIAITTPTDKRFIWRLHK